MMLLVFEGMLCRQRLLSILMLRATKVVDSSVYVYRLMKWTKLSTFELLPGDIISLSSDSEGNFFFFVFSARIVNLILRYGYYSL